MAKTKGEQVMANFFQNIGRGLTRSVQVNRNVEALKAIKRIEKWKEKAMPFWSKATPQGKEEWLSRDKYASRLKETYVILDEIFGGDA